MLRPFVLILLLVLCIDPAVSHAAINFAAATGLPAGQVREMQFFLDQTDQRQKSGPAMRLSEIEQIASFLVRWVSESRALPKGRSAAALYAADVLLASCRLLDEGSTDKPVSRAVLDSETAKLRVELKAAGADFEYDELADSYDYRHNWLQDAFRIAPIAQPASKHFWRCWMMHSTLLAATQATVLRL